MSDLKIALLLGLPEGHEIVEVGRDELLAAIARKQLPIIEAIKTVRQVLGVSLGEAKAIVSDHPAYRPTAEAARPFHDDLIRAAEDPEPRPGLHHAIHQSGPL